MADQVVVAISERGATLQDDRASESGYDPIRSREGRKQMKLLDETRTYLEAEHFTVAERSPGLLVGEKPGVGGAYETMWVWILDQMSADDIRRREPSLLTKFGEANDVDPTASKFLLAPTYQGMSVDFSQDAKRWFNVSITVPAFFFDTDFRWDSGRATATAARRLKDRGDATRRSRVPQPYLDEIGAVAGQDLLRTVYDQLKLGTGPNVHIIAGPAGAGKSILFESLYASLYDNFHANKQKQVRSPRPVPLLPEYLEFSDAPTVKALLRAFLETDFVRALDGDTFHWMMTHGSALWMLDGLDEVIAQDPGFFEFLLELLTDPDASRSPQVVICIRDSLLSSNDDLRDLCESYPEAVVTHVLAPWDIGSKKRYAEITLRDQATPFMEVLAGRPDLDSLSATPYYCALLADLFAQGDLRADYSEADLLSHALSSIIDREYTKGVLDSAISGESTIIEFLEAMALNDLENGLRGVPVGTTREFAQVLLPADIPDQELARFVGQFSQIALFS